MPAFFEANRTEAKAATERGKMLSISHISDLHPSDHSIIFLHGHLHQLDADDWGVAPCIGTPPPPPRAKNPPPINMPVMRLSPPDGAIWPPPPIGGIPILDFYDENYGHGTHCAGTLFKVPERSDVRLIATCDAALNLGDEINTLSVRENWSDERINEATDRHNALIREACAMPARSELGRAAKARIIREQRRGEDDGYDEEDCMLTSLLRDLKA